MANGVKMDREHLKPVPVGNSGWEEFSQKCYTVDKTLLIKELIDNDTKVALFTRPRRFGKTTALRMLKAFFEKAPKDTSYLFKSFKIWSAGEKYRAEQGKCPLGFIAILRNRYKVKSNRESGDGRFDIALTPLVKDFPGVIVEVKAAKSETDDLRALAQEARDQIDRKNYAAEMTSEGVADILKLGLSYHKKNVELVR